MVALSVLLSFLGVLFLEQLLNGGGKVEWCASSASTMSGLGYMAQWSLGDSRALMDSRRAKVSSGVVVASMVGS
jgi:hypothetical protein